jgi:hypothetical protein
MAVQVISASLIHDGERSYKGRVQFQVDGHDQTYEVALFSKNKRDWDYSLMFANESGSEQNMFLVEEMLENDDDLFDTLVDAAMNSLDEASR